MISHRRLSTAALAALSLAAQSALAATTVTTPFRGVTHIERVENNHPMIPRLVVMHIVQIDLTDPGISFLATPGNGAAPGEFTGQKTSSFVSQHNLQIGMNADFFSSAGTGPNGEIYRDVTNLAASNGSLISPWPNSPGTVRGAMNISATNVPTMVRAANGSTSGGTYNTNPTVTLYNTVGGSNRMIANGVNIVGSSSFELELHPRTCIGYDNSNRMYFFTVDGRQPGYSEGMNLLEIANFMQSEYGVTNLLNLDGGGSTTMVMQDPVLRVVNRPSDGTERTNGNNIGLFATQWPQWGIDGNGNWAVSANWTGALPNGVGHVANFRSAITSNRTVTVNAPITVGTINFEHNKSYTIDGAQVLTLDTSTGDAAINLTLPASQIIMAPMKLNDAVNITTATNATLAMAGSLNNSSGKAIVKNGPGMLVISGTQTHGSGASLTVNAGTLSLSSNAGSLTTANLTVNANATTSIVVQQNLAALNVGGTATVTALANGTRTVKTKALSIASGAKYQANDNDVIVDHAGGNTTLGTYNGTAYTGVLGMIQRAYNGGEWNGTGLTSAFAATSNGLTTLAAAEASFVLGLGGSQTAAWSGQNVDATSVLVKYTWGGDADLNGVLDGDDYFRIDSNILQNGSVFGYHNGDFNFDGAIDGDDYFVIDSNFTAAQSQLQGGLVAIPEPHALAALVVACPFAASRRRRAN